MLSMQHHRFFYCFLIMLLHFERWLLGLPLIIHAEQQNRTTERDLVAVAQLVFLYWYTVEEGTVVTVEIKDLERAAIRS